MQPERVTLFFSGKGLQGPELFHFTPTSYLRRIKKGKDNLGSATKAIRKQGEQTENGYKQKNRFLKETGTTYYSSSQQAGRLKTLCLRTINIFICNTGISYLDTEITNLINLEYYDVFHNNILIIRN